MTKNPIHKLTLPGVDGGWFLDLTQLQALRLVTPRLTTLDNAASLRFVVRMMMRTPQSTANPWVTIEWMMAMPPTATATDPAVLEAIAASDGAMAELITRWNAVRTGEAQ